MTLVLGFGTGISGCVKRSLPGVGLAPGPKSAELDLWRPRPDGVKLYVEADLGDGVGRMFLLDTGADVSAMSAKVAAELELKPVPQRGGVAGMGGRVERWAAVRVDRVELGPFDVHGVDFAVGVPGVPTRAGLVPVAGILGANVWQQFQLAIDYPANVLELYRPGMMPAEELATTLPMYMSRGHSRVAAELVVTDPSAPDGIRRVPWELEVDTGAYDVVLAGNPNDAQGLAELATTGIEPIFGIGADDSLPVSSFLRTTRRVSLEGVVLGDVFVEESFDARWIDYRAQGGFAPPDMPGLIGHKLFDAHRLILDFPGRRMALVEASREARPQDIHTWALAHARRPSTNEQLRQRARYLIALDRMDDALSLMTAHVGRHPEDLESVVMGAHLLRASGDPDAADRVLAGLQAADLVDRQAVVTVVNSLWLSGDIDGAMKLAEAAVRSRPDEAVSHVALADATTAAGDFGRARRALSEANRIAEDPDGQLLRRAWVASREGDVAAAFTHFRRRLDLYPSGPYTPWLYAWTAKNGELDGIPELSSIAVSDIDRAMKRLHPGDGPVDFVAAALVLSGEAGRAEVLMQQGIERDCPRAADVESRDNCRAWYAGLVGQDLDEAWAAIQRAVDAEPTRSDFLDTFAVVAEARGDLDAARDAARRAARLSPEDVYLLWQVRRLDSAATAAR